jgi:hypothetical protein
MSFRLLEFDKMEYRTAILRHINCVRTLPANVDGFSYTQLFEPKKKNFKPHIYYCKPMKNDANSRKANGNLGLLLTEKADDILSSFEKDLYNSQLKYRMIFVYKHFD